MTRKCLISIAIVLGSCSDARESFCRTGGEIKYREKYGEILTFTYTDSNSIRFASSKFVKSEELFPFENDRDTFNFLGRIIIKIEEKNRYSKNGLDCVRTSAVDDDLISCNLNNATKYTVVYSKSIGIKSIRVAHPGSEYRLDYKLESQYGLARVCP